MRSNPARPGAGLALCRVDELADPGSKGFVFRDEAAIFSGFVVRLGDAVKGYVDSCPHAGWRLAGIGDNFLTRDERYILCAGHGALFRPDDGECVAGPCFGDRLDPWPVRVEDGVIVTDEPSHRKPPPYWGGCHCGRVRYQIRAEPVNVRVCHCRSCQKWAGSAFFARAIFPRTAVELGGAIETYASSADLRRGFCAHCGSPVTTQRLSRPDRIGISLSTLDEPNALPPEAHTWVSEKLDWVNIDDGLPQYPQGAPP
ncbi:MAG: Rieske (2Fe-2S) iron-sulfur domain protein [Caulobacteraceae bacterium]|nr:Rieske (2Fe-2S) iron-sulfur domain protein [Caulobacteraceae bacterium]